MFLVEYMDTVSVQKQFIHGEFCAIPVLSTLNILVFVFQPYKITTLCPNGWGNSSKNIDMRSTQIVLFFNVYVDISLPESVTKVKLWQIILLGFYYIKTVLWFLYKVTSFI